MQPPGIELLELTRAVAAYDGTAASAANVEASLPAAARALGAANSVLELHLPGVAALRTGTGAPGEPLSLRAPDGTSLGTMFLDGDPAGRAAIGDAVTLGASAAHALGGWRRSRAEIEALDAAVRGISGVLDLDRVLQLIADRVRDLVDAGYAAIGVVDEGGRILRFITSGISREERERIGELPRGHGLLGLIIRENRPIRVADIGTHPDSVGFPAHHPPMRSFLGLPILAEGRPVGRLYLTEKRGANEFSVDDQALVERFALHAGIAIESATLHDQAARLAVVDERDRISRDLHDSVIQAIYAQTLLLDDVPDLVATEPDEAARRVDVAIDALHALIRDIRNFIFGLQPVLLDAGDLVDGVRQLANELRRNGGVDVSVEVTDGAAAALPSPVETIVELLAIVREALSNIARHAGATAATVRLAAADGRLILEIRDDGRGFADDVPGRAAGHHGLANMRSRTTAIGGTFTLDSHRGGGTRIIVAYPSPGGTDGGRDPT